MNNEAHSLLPFLERLGIEAYILPDVIYGNLIMIETESYTRCQRQVDAWFTFVRQIGRHSYFRVRLRGTGDTL